MVAAGQTHDAEPTTFTEEEVEQLGGDVIAVSKI
jgi:hypothetical protein